MVAARLEASAGDLVGDQGTHRGGPAPPAGTWSWGRGQQADVGLEGKGVFVAEDAGWLPVPGDHLQDEGLRGGVQLGYLRSSEAQRMAPLCPELERSLCSVLAELSLLMG